jgi:hypothetical protein
MFSFLVFFSAVDEVGSRTATLEPNRASVTQINDDLMAHVTFPAHDG